MNWMSTQQDILPVLSIWTSVDMRIFGVEFSIINSALYNSGLSFSDVVWPNKSISYMGLYIYSTFSSLIYFGPWEAR